MEPIEKREFDPTNHCQSARYIRGKIELSNPNPEDPKDPTLLFSKRLGFF